MPQGAPGIPSVESSVVHFTFSSGSALVQCTFEEIYKDFRATEAAKRSWKVGGCSVLASEFRERSSSRDDVQTRKTNMPAKCSIEGTLHGG